MNKNVGTGHRRSYCRGYADIKSLNHLPGYKLSDKNFFAMTGANNFIANQTTVAKDISSQLQNILKTHIQNNLIRNSNIFQMNHLTSRLINYFTVNSQSST